MVSVPFQVLPGAVTLAMLPIICLVAVSFFTNEKAHLRILCVLLMLLGFIFLHSFFYSTQIGFGFDLVFKFGAGIVVLIGCMSFRSGSVLLSNNYLVAFLLVQIFSVYCYFFGMFDTRSGSGRMTGFLDHPGNLQIFCVFAVVFLSINLFETDNRVTKLLCFMCVLCLAIELWFAGGRKAILAGGVGLSFYFLISLRRHLLGISLLCACFAGISLFAVDWAFQNSDVLPSIRLIRILDAGELLDTGNRVEQYRFFLGKFLESPIFGHGLGLFYYSFGHDFHNTIGALLYSFGVVGFLVIVGLILTTLVMYTGTLDSARVLLPLLFALAAVSFFANFLRNDIFWVCLGLTALLGSSVDCGSKRAG